jgi:hypothetical protein
MTKAKPLPTIEEAASILRYEQDTGIFYWKINAGRKKVAGLPAGYKNKKGYLVISINNKEYRAHRLAWLLGKGQDPLEMQVDHINGIKSDNRLSNLRLATNSQNACNRGTSSRNTSGFKGVSYSRKRKAWKVDVRVNGTGRHIGCFATPELAHMAYCKAAAELHGEFARGS